MSKVIKVEPLNKGHIGHNFVLCREIVPYTVLGDTNVDKFSCFVLCCLLEVLNVLGEKMFGTSNSDLCRSLYIGWGLGLDKLFFFFRLLFFLTILKSSAHYSYLVDPLFSC